MWAEAARLSRDGWDDLLLLAARMRRVDAANLIAVHGQRPTATVLRSHHRWNTESNRTILPSERNRAIRVLTGSGPGPERRLAFVWDISQTTGAGPGPGWVRQSRDELVAAAAVPTHPDSPPAAGCPTPLASAADVGWVGVLARLHWAAHDALGHDPARLAAGCAGRLAVEANSVMRIVAWAVDIDVPPDLPATATWCASGADLTATLDQVITASRRLLPLPEPPPMPALRARALAAARATTGLAAGAATTLARARLTPAPSAGEPPARRRAVAHQQAEQRAGRLYAAHEEAAHFYRTALLAEAGAGARAYLADRRVEHVLDSGASRWLVGLAPPGWTSLTGHLRRRGFSDDELEAAGLARRARTGRLIDAFRDRIVIAARDPSGRIVGFVGRAAAGTESERNPKYLNSRGTVPAELAARGWTPIYHKARLLPGLWEHRAALADGGPPIIVEGPFDALAIEAAIGGAFPVVFPSGTALTAEQAALLLALSPHRPGIISAFDPDLAGWKATGRAYDILIGGENRLWRLDLPAGVDPAQLLADAGPQALRAALVDPARRSPMALAAIDALLDYYVRDDVHANTLHEPIAQTYAPRDIEPIITAAPPEIFGQMFAHVAAQLDLSNTELTDALVAAHLDRTSPARPDPPVRPAQPGEDDIAVLARAEAAIRAAFPTAVTLYTPTPSTSPAPVASTAAPGRPEGPRR